MFLPIENHAICPSGASCLLNSGGKFSLMLERRVNHFGLLVGYSAVAIDADGLFELGAMHELKAGLRYTFMEHLRLQPSVQLDGGAFVFGGIDSVVTTGGFVNVGIRLSFELTSTFFVVLGNEHALYTFLPFANRFDNVPRSKGFGVNWYSTLVLGFSLRL